MVAGGRRPGNPPTIPGMARYRVRETTQGVAIRVTEVSEPQQEQLLEAFEECRSGRCTCPTDEYEKLGGMQIDSGEEEIELRLEAKTGERFDTAEISRCLDHATSGVSDR